MSADPEPPTRRSEVAYDGAEIRGRMAVCFTLSELRQFVQELGVGGVPWDRGISEAARQLVRHFERRGDMTTLVGRLRQARPLMEWPEPLRSAAAPLPAPAPEPSALDLPDPGSTPRHERTLRSERHQPLNHPLLPNTKPFMPAEGERDEDAEQTVVRSPRKQVLPERSPHPGAEPLRGERSAGGLDARVLLAVAVLMVVAVVGAYLVGRTEAPPAGPSSGANTPAPARRPEGVATRAADAIMRSLDHVAHACEIEPGPPSDLLRRALVQCGPEPLAPPKAPTRVVAPPVTDAPPQPPAPGAHLPPPPVTPAAPGAASPAGCLNACDRQHQACKANQCGGEPTEGSKYNAYQACLGKCLVDFSRCRLDCQ